jgi:hypothetical protein
MQTKFESHEICGELIIYYGKVVKNGTKRFWTKRHTCCLETEASNSKLHSVYSHLTWFEVLVKFKFGFWLQNIFSNDTYNIHCVMLVYDIFFASIS